MFAQTADLYDAIYSFKDYDREADQIHALIHQHKTTPDNGLLDIACGTGKHLTKLQVHYACEGMDLDPRMGSAFRERHPRLPFHQGDMVDFDLGKQYGAVVCLFSSIGYTVTRDRLFSALRAFERHTAPGGVVIVEPWHSPDQFKPGYTGANFVDLPDLKIARMYSGELTPDAWVLRFSYLVARNGKVEHLEETHSMGLFTDKDYREAFCAAGLEVTFEPEGLTARGLYIGKKAA
jgi:ubiquinone/menaquinone biosynthesis C-methylase UbiE